MSWQGGENKNLQIEVLRKLLHDEIGFHITNRSTCYNC